MRRFGYIYAASLLLTISAATDAAAQQKVWTRPEIDAALFDAGIVDKLPEPEQNVDCRVFMKKLGRTTAQQGMEIYGNYIFSGEDGGHVNVYDFREASRLFEESADTVGGIEPVADFMLGSSRKDNHVNNIEFGPRRAKGSRFPLLYVSNGKVGSEIEWECAVERICLKKGNFSPEVVQTIRLDGSDWKTKGYAEIFGAPSWMVDKKRSELWVFSAVKRTVAAVTKDPTENSYIATCFRLPSLKEGRYVNLGADDIVRQCIFPYDVWFTQAGCMYDGKIYYGYGIGRHDLVRPSCIRVYDTDSGKISARYELNDEIVYEIEDIVLRDGWLYVNCNNNRKLTKEPPYVYRLSLPSPTILSDTHPTVISTDRMERRNLK